MSIVMTSPSGETLEAQNEQGAHVLEVLGWTRQQSRTASSRQQSDSSSSSEEGEEQVKRGPGRPRKNTSTDR